MRQVILSGKILATVKYNQVLPFCSTGYKDLQTRKETREAAWQRPGWDEVVQYTGTLVYHYK